MIYFTTDTHLGHSNLVVGVSSWEGLDRCRPFGTIEEHDATIIDNINSRVRKNDTLYHLGDFAISSNANIIAYRDRIRCQNIHLIYGNHDEPIRKRKILRNLFSSCNDILRINHERQAIILCHYAMRVWYKSHRGTWMLCGHSHGSLNLENCGKILDICPENHNYTPWSFSEVYDYMSSRNIEKVDHH